MRWNALFVPSKCSIVVSVVAKTGTRISCAMDGVSPIKNGGSSNQMARLNCTLVYGKFLPHRGGRSGWRHATATWSNSTAFVFAVVHSTILLLQKCSGSKPLVRGYCPHRKDTREEGTTMPVDNEIYNRLSSTWWDEQAFAILRTGANPGRFGYFRQVLLKQVGVDPVGKQALDVGCGGGLLAEEFARLGCQVTGLDPSEPSLATARAHARQSGLDIAYRVGV